MERMFGVVQRIMLNRGFAFVRGDDRRQRFFHARNVKPVSAFDTMFVGQRVSFVPEGELDERCLLYTSPSPRDS